ncbi:MAG: DUF5696 domain-containing protein [Candidatus Brocadiia bacterium]
MGPRARQALLPGIALACLSSAPSLGAGDERPWIELPPGTTRLAELGAYRVAYQLYGGEPVEMPLGWSGQFTDDVGIAYADAGHPGGRSARVLHCPWRRGPGRVSLEYFLELPERRPVVLRFGIAMRPDVTEKSDGATFTAYVVAGGERRELMREHYAKGEWKDFRFDLSAHAGARIVLGFQTEPGPERNTAFDFSLLGEPTITVGREEDRRPGVVEEIVASRAYKVAAGRDLAALANDPSQGIVPSTDDPHETRVRKTDTGFLFAYRGEDCRIEYTYATAGDGSLDALSVRVDGGAPFRPCMGGGVEFAPLEGSPYAFRAPGRAELLSAVLDDGRLRLRWRYGLGERTAEVAWTFRLVGKALAIAGESDSRELGRLSLGRPLNRGLRRPVAVPYLPFASAYFLRPQNVYAMSYLDWTRSMASRTPGGEAVYLPGLDGTRNKLRDAGYVAVSPQLAEVLPNVPHPPSPCIQELAPRLVLDIWGGTFDRGAALLRDLKSYGVDHAAVIWHNWQRYGYDVKLPDHLPANPALGGDEAMARLAAAARDVGYLFALHENYIDFYPDAPSYDPKHVVLDPNGRPSKAWYHPGTKVQSFALKAGRMLHYAAQNSPEIHRRFATTAAYLDVHTCVPPWHHVDYEPGTELAASHRLKVRVHRQLFQFQRDTHGGPLFGEGANHFFWAGLVDGVEAQVGGGEDCPLLVDFDLLKLHPQMVNHGMGYYTRWLRTGRQTRWGVEAPTPAQLDKYRATTLAFGHAGFVGAQLVYTPYFAWREHNLLTPVQALYAAGKPTDIRYGVDGSLVRASAAVAAGTLDRLRVRYDSGLVLHVNLREADWAVDGYVLPQFGFLARGPELLAYTARRDGVIVDYAEDARTLFCDARTHIHRPWEQGAVDVEPRIRSLEHLGDGLLAISYEWAVGERLGADPQCFVHFVDPRAGEGESICFQDDHSLQPPPSQWRPGSVVADGPHRVRVPAEGDATRYDVAMGLWHPGDGRLALKGVSLGQQRVLVGRLAVRRDGGRVVDVQLEGIESVRKRQDALRRRFEERMNTAGVAVDFGKVVTDGSVKIYKRGPASRILPYPRGKAFGVAIDLSRVLPGLDPASVRLRAVDAEGRAVDADAGTVDGRWLRLRAGAPRAAAFVFSSAQAEAP